MPEYLTPAVYVEETSFRSRSIEGVPTSTFGMAGVTEYGPVPYTVVEDGLAEVLMVPGPSLVTSFTEYERAFGGMSVNGDPCWLALAARAFFANGGRRLYVSRVFSYTRTDPVPPATEGELDPARNFAQLALPATGTALVRWQARWPGTYGRAVKVTVDYRRSKNVLIGGRLTGVAPGAAIELVATGTAVADRALPAYAAIRTVQRNSADPTQLGFLDDNGDFQPPPDGMAGYHLSISVTVEAPGDRVDVYSGLEIGTDHPRSVFTVLQHRDPPDEFALVWLQNRTALTPGTTPGQLLEALLNRPQVIPPGRQGPFGAYLSGGGAGVDVTADDLQGQTADPDNFRNPATGLEALGEIDDIAIVAMPDTVRFSDDAAAVDAVNALIEHCQRLRYRMAIIDPPKDSSISQVREFRSKFDTKYAALYYPWVRLVDPTRRPDPGGPTPMLDLPPSGYVAGIYARSDIERGVHKAPANEVVLGIDKFVTNVTFDRQSVLNPEGVNALRFFEGRSNRVWGARTMSSDPEWKYVNVRRLFIYLEHSIDKATQWAVFEPNNERLWASIRETIEDFLVATWRTGALMGTKPEEAFFVRCDRTTMTQNDLDNGRLICLIGVSPTYPAEFVIFRIGQWTADSQRG
jgi:phage tail sheath protein FI